MHIKKYSVQNPKRLLLFDHLQEKCAQYWPSDGVVVYGDISIELKREEESESYTVRDLLVTNNRVRRKRTHALQLRTDDRNIINGH